MPKLHRSIAMVAISFAGTAPLHAQTSKAVAHVVITGGPKAGTYDADNGAHGGCSTGSDGPGTFGVQLSNPKGAPDKFNSVQLLVAKPSPTGSTQFTLAVGFGSLMNRTKEYLIETRATKQSGKGSVTVKDGGGASASVTFDATTSDGVHIVGTVACTGVIRM